MSRFIVVLATLTLAAAALVTPAPPATGAPPASGEDLAIIINRSNPVGDISHADLRRIFLAEQQHWPNGRRMTVVMQGGGRPERAAVLRGVYRMSEQDYEKHFLRAEFTGEVRGAPKTVASGASARKFVYNVPGAIGYVRASEVDDSVKVVAVGGSRPGEPGYRLKVSGR